MAGLAQGREGGEDGVGSAGGIFANHPVGPADPNNFHIGHPSRERRGLPQNNFTPLLRNNGGKKCGASQTPHLHRSGLTNPHRIATTDPANCLHDRI